MVIGIFTDIESVKQQAYAVIGIAAAGTFPDMWQGYLQGPIKALALQGKVIQYNFIAYWMINFPLGYLFAF